MATSTVGAQRGMLEQVVVQRVSGQNLFSSSEMRTVPRVGETFNIGGQEYFVKRVEHSITNDQKEHQIWIHVE
jgi:hypothetical protein